MTGAAVRAPGGGPRQDAPATPAWVLAVAAGALALAALSIAVYAGVKGVAGVPDAVRGVLAALVLFGVTGYAPARGLTPRALRAHLPFFVLGFGAAVSCLGLSMLGFFGVPIVASLVLLLGGGLVAGLLLRVRRGPARAEEAVMADAGGRTLAWAWPSYIALILIALCLIPTFRAGYGSVPGTNPDGMLSVGTAEFLQHNPPTAVDPALPVDQMPPVWRSKYPIYYGLAGAATLSGLDPVAAYTGFAAVVAALAALGFMLLARYALRAPPAVAVVALALVAFARVTPYLAIHPYFNQLWGALSLGFMLLFGLRFLDDPNRRDAVAALLFVALGLSAYPLMVVFPALAFLAAVVSLRRRGHRGWIRGLGLPRGRRSLLLWVPLGILVVPAALIVTLGVLEKSASATNLMLGREDLKAWRGDLTSFPGPDFYLGPPGVAGYVVAAAVLVAAFLGLRRAPATARAALGAAVVGGLVLGVYFRLRTYGEYFDLKVLSFLTPLLLVSTAPWLAERLTGARTAARYGVMVAVGLVLAGQLAGLRQELGRTALQVDRETFVLRDVARKLPPGSFRVDVPPSGRHLWASYYLNERRLSSYTPVLYTTYPHVPGGRKADFILADKTVKLKPWPDADGPPIWQNRIWKIYRMKRGVPGPDRSSRTMQDDFGGTF